LKTLCDRYALLNDREREVMALVVTGLLNKQVGFELGISEITAKAHAAGLCAPRSRRYGSYQGFGGTHDRMIDFV
jgi:FixJ family two-component response regulator